MAKKKNPLETILSFLRDADDAEVQTVQAAVNVEMKTRPHLTQAKPRKPRKAEAPKPE